MINFLLDTDVILDYYYGREPHWKYTQLILAICGNKLGNGFVTPIGLSNLYYMLRKQAPHEKVIGDIKDLLTIINVVEINKTSVLDALNSDFNDFEDALQNFSATNSHGIRLIVTRNLKDYKKSQISVVSPIQYLKVFHNLDYTSNTTSS